MFWICTQIWLEGFQKPRGKPWQALGGRWFEVYGCEVAPKPCSSRNGRERGSGSVRRGYRGGRDWEGVEERFLRAIELNPSFGDAWHYYGHFLMSTLRVEEAVEAALRGVELDPLGRSIRLHLVVSYYNARRYDEAIAVSLETSTRFPDYSRARSAPAPARSPSAGREASARAAGFCRRAWEATPSACSCNRISAAFSR